MFGTAADVASMEKSLDKARADPAFTKFLQEIGPDLALIPDKRLHVWPDANKLKLVKQQYTQYFGDGASSLSRKPKIPALPPHPQAPQGEDLGAAGVGGKEENSNETGFQLESDGNAEDASSNDEVADVGGEEGNADETASQIDDLFDDDESEDEAISKRGLGLLDPEERGSVDNDAATKFDTHYSTHPGDILDCSSKSLARLPHSIFDAVGFPETTTRANTMRKEMMTLPFCQQSYMRPLKCKRTYVTVIDRSLSSFGNIVPCCHQPK